MTPLSLVIVCHWDFKAFGNLEILLRNVLHPLLSSVCIPSIWSSLDSILLSLSSSCFVFFQAASTMVVLMVVVPPFLYPKITSSGLYSGFLLQYGIGALLSSPSPFCLVILLSLFSIVFLLWLLFLQWYSLLFNLFSRFNKNTIAINLPKHWKGLQIILLHVILVSIEASLFVH